MSAYLVLAYQCMVAGTFIYKFGNAGISVIGITRHHILVHVSKQKLDFLRLLLSTLRIDSL